MKARSSIVLKLCFSLLFGFVLLELALRVYTPIPFTVKKGRVVLPSNKTYVFENKTIPSLDRIITNRRNSLGFRGPEPPKDFENYLTVVTIGGSTTACDYLSDGKTWTDLLSKNLAPQFPNLWMNNAGNTGHSTFGHLLLMQDYVLSVKPDIALFLVGANDVETESVRRLDKNILKGRLDFTSPKEFAFSLLRTSEVINLTWNLLRTLKSHKRNLVHHALDLKNQPTEKTSEEERQRILDENKTKYISAYRGRLNQLIDLCEKNGITPIFVTQPALFGRTNDDQTGVNLGTVQVYEGRDGATMEDVLALYNDEVRDVGRLREVAVIDLAKTLPKSSAYYYDFYHYTNKGAVKIAELLATDLTPLLKKT